MGGQLINWKPGDEERRKVEMGIEERHQKIIVAAEQAQKVLADAAALAVKTVSEAATLAQSVINKDIEYIKKEVGDIKSMLDRKYVTSDQFAPVRMIAYGMVALILVAVVGALMTLIITRKPV